jgi:hypothetical protein
MAAGAFVESNFWKKVIRVPLEKIDSFLAPCSKREARNRLGRVALF